MQTHNWHPSWLFIRSVLWTPEGDVVQNKTESKRLICSAQTKTQLFEVMQKWDYLKTQIHSQISLSLLFLVLLLRLISNLLISLDRSLGKKISHIFTSNYYITLYTKSCLKTNKQNWRRLNSVLWWTHSKMNSSVKTGFWPSRGWVLATWTLFK